MILYHGSINMAVQPAFGAGKLTKTTVERVSVQKALSLPKSGLVWGERMVLQVSINLTFPASRFLIWLRQIFLLDMACYFDQISLIRRRMSWDMRLIGSQTRVIRASVRFAIYFPSRKFPRCLRWDIPGMWLGAMGGACELRQKIPVQKIPDLYLLGHEQDVRNAADILSEWMDTN